MFNVLKHDFEKTAGEKRYTDNGIGQISITTNLENSVLEMNSRMLTQPGTFFNQERESSDFYEKFSRELVTLVAPEKTRIKLVFSEISLAAEGACGSSQNDLNDFVAVHDNGTLVGIYCDTRWFLEDSWKNS